MISDHIEKFNENYAENFAKLRAMIEKWVREIPHSEFFDLDSALNEYFDNDKSYSTVYAKRFFLSKIREARNCWDLQKLFSKLEYHNKALFYLLCSEMALNNRPLFAPLLMTLESDSNISDNEFDNLCFTYGLPENLKVKDMLREAGGGDWVPLVPEKVSPEQRFSNAEYEVVSYVMISFDMNDL